MRKSSSTWPRKVLIAANRDDYDVQLSRDWAKDFASLADRASLGEAANDLTLDLRCAAITASFPFLIASQLEQFISGWVRGREAASSAENYVDRLVGNICRELATGPSRELFDSRHFEAIRAVCLGIKQQVNDVPELAAAKADGWAWEMYSSDYGFQTNAWGSQRSAYLSAYSGYEHFLIQCLRRLKQQPTYRYRSNAIETDLQENIGDYVVENCWNRRSLQIAREVRHALTHNGGKETDKLRNSITPPHEIEVLGPDKMLQIFPRDVKALLEAIEKSAMWVWPSPVL